MALIGNISLIIKNSMRCAEIFTYVLSTMGVSKESISKFLIGNRCHVKLHILSPY